MKISINKKIRLHLLFDSGYSLSKKIKLDSRSKYLRKLVLECLFGGDRGHMGSAMSLIEILRVLRFIT